MSCVPRLLVHPVCIARRTMRWLSTTSGFRVWCRITLVTCWLELTASIALLTVTSQHGDLVNKPGDPSWINVPFCWTMYSSMRICRLAWSSCRNLQEVTRSMWRYEMILSVLPLLILLHLLCQIWSVALGVAREALLISALGELLLAMIAGLCSCFMNFHEPGRPSQRRPPLSALLEVRRSAIEKFIAQSRSFSFQLDAEGPQILGGQGSELHQDMCTICLIDFAHDDLASRLPCRHVYHPACIESWARSMQGPFIGCPLRCEIGRVKTSGAVPI
ncbi:unnamed protein product [Polarella glacialis]|uniref:RING-type domain-containing protein n=1 Tax=Polarella glacialis TaxID=89957 RepID=A0A813HCL0_POLGL|nr:unnamed protein product [Polarella glacialis]